MTALRVEYIDGGDYLVRGTADLTEDDARTAVVEYLVRVEAEDDSWGSWSPADIAADVAKYRCEIRLYRKTPCNCGGGHSWDMHPAAGRGHGVFTAAYLDR